MSPWKGLIKFCFRREASFHTKNSGMLMLVPGMFLFGGTFKSPEINAFPKLKLPKILLSFWRPWAPTSISTKQQLVSATRSKFERVKAFVIKIQKSDVWWAFVAAMFLVNACYEIRHFTNVVEHVQFAAFFRSTNCHKYWLQYFPNRFAELSYNAFYYNLSNLWRVSQRRKWYSSGKIYEEFFFQILTNVRKSGTI